MNQPICLGTYEAGHQQCDGIAQAIDPAEQAPCAWRDRCVGLQAFCKERDHDVQRVITALGTGLVDLCESQIKKLNITNGLINNITTNTTKPINVEKIPKPVVKAVTPPPIPAAITDALKAAKAASEKAKAITASRRTVRQKATSPADTPIPVALPTTTIPVNSSALAPTTGSIPAIQPSTHMLPPTAYFAECLRQAFPNNPFAKPKRVAARAGTFYAVERPKSRYLRWYCVGNTGRDAALACLYYKARIAMVDVALPVTKDQLIDAAGPALASTLMPVPIHDGQFKCLCKNLDKPGVQTIVSLIAKMAKTGSIKLPTPKEQ